MKLFPKPSSDLSRYHSFLRRLEPPDIAIASPVGKLLFRVFEVASSDFFEHFCADDFALQEAGE